MTQEVGDVNERCLWTDTANPVEEITGVGSAALPESTDVAVIGAGYTGLSAALTMARRGTDVTVLERNTVGWGASGRNGGFVLPGFKPEMEELARRLGSDRARRMFELSLEAIGYVQSLIRQEGESPPPAGRGAATRRRACRSRACERSSSGAPR